MRLVFGVLCVVLAAAILNALSYIFKTPSGEIAGLFAIGWLIANEAFDQ